jgi:hypothetical protein
MVLFKTKQDLISKQVGSELILYDSDNGVIHILNVTAAAIFKLCDSSHTSEDIAKALEESFDGIEYIQAHEDVKRVLDVFESNNLFV